jgi:uncharacterized protein (TIGR03435 family)
MRAITICAIWIIFPAMSGPELRAQLPAPAFEVASVRPSHGTTGVKGGCHGIDSQYGPKDAAGAPPLGRCVITHGRLSHFINIAWGLGDIFLIKSKPDWIARGSDRFDIAAKAEDPRKATEAQLIEMLQTLLIERFQMKFHREAVEKSGFALMFAKKGPKLQESTADGVGISSTGGKPLDGQPVKLKASRYSMVKLANVLSVLGPGPVIDKTGLAGVYDFTLAWDETAGPSLFTALQDQLGLRLEPQKVSVSYFVIDSAQKPGEN